MAQALPGPQQFGDYKHMSDWRERSTLNGDVAFFQYVDRKLELKAQEVYVWDLDKTYLDTKIDSLSGIFNAAVEKALNKKNVPGTNALLSALSDYRTQILSRDNFPIYFITASPPQMEERISEKFALDHIQPYGCFYKDNLANLRPGRFWRLTKQVGYKLQALMQLRTRLPEQIKQICWGDDSETDAIIYNLYSDICSRRLGPQEIRAILEKLHVSGDQVDTILQFQSEIPEYDPLEKIYINLAIDTDADYYLKFGRRTVGTNNTFQIALDLVQDQRLHLEGLESVMNDMLTNYHYTKEELVQSFDEMIRRGLIGQVAYEKIKNFLVDKKILYPTFTPSIKPAKEKLVVNGHVYEMEGAFEPWVPQHIEYLREDR